MPRHQLSDLRETLAGAEHRTAEILSGTLHLPQIPARCEFFANAKAIFARTKSLDEIVDRAYKVVMAAVGAPAWWLA